MAVVENLDAGRTVLVSVYLIAAPHNAPQFPVSARERYRVGGP